MISAGIQDALSFRALATRNKHANIVTVQQDLAELVLRRVTVGIASVEVVLGHVGKNHIDVVVKAEKSAGELFLGLHNNPDA